MGVVTPIGIGLKDYSQALRQGVSGATTITHFDVSQYPTKFAGVVKGFKPEDYIDAKKLRRQARFTQFALAATRMALEQSGLDLQKEDLSRIGAITGTGIGGLDIIEQEHRNLLEKGPRRVSPFLIPMIITNIVPGEIAIAYGFTGPNFAVSSACASSNHAIGEALRALRYGDADVMITGGTEAAVTPLGLAGFCTIRALSTRNDSPETASRPFSKSRDGFVMGEGAGIIILETLEHALARGAKILAELAGYGASDDAYHITAPEPTGKAAVQAIESALKDAEVSPQEVNYINAHGTSTEYNDKTETAVIKEVFGERAYKIPISSTKSMTGHLLGAAGAVELIATVLQINEGFIHPTINYTDPDPECDLDYVPNKAREANIQVAISNSLGFGGHNSVLVVKKYNG